MEIERKAKDFKTLSKVVTRTDLESIFLSDCNVWRSLNALEYEEVGAEISFNGALLEDHGDHFIAKATLSAKGQPKGRHPDKEVVSLECEYILTYSLRDREELTIDDIKQFCHMNAVYNAWPYWREFLQNMSNRMELPVLILPLLKFGQPKKKKEKNTKHSK